jgi:phosphoribosylanthranilate isomerase
MSVLVKICGLSTPETLDVALDAGADMVGFVFFAPSPRNVSLHTARELGARVKGRAEKVALTVDADDALLASIVDVLQPDMLQLHGSETPARVSAIHQRFSIPVMKVLPVETKADLGAIPLYTRVADRLLFDARAPAASASRSTGTCSTISIHQFHSCFPGGSTRRMSPKHCASPALPGLTYPPASKAPPA